MSYEFDISSVPPLIAAIVVSIIIFFLLKSRRKEKNTPEETIIFLLLLFSLLIWDIGEAFFSGATDYNTAMFWARISNTGLVMLPGLLLHFTVIYPVEKEGYRRHRYLFLASIYWPGLILAASILFTKAFFNLHHDPTSPFRWDYQPRIFYLVFMLYFFSYIIGSILMLFNSFKYIRDSNVKRQTKFMMAGLVLFIILIYFDDNISKILVSNLADSLITLSLAVFFAIAAFKYNLMDIQVIVEKSIAYSSISVIMATIFVIISEGLENLVSAINIFNMDPIVSQIVAALVVSFTVDPIQHRVKKWADGIFDVKSFEED